MFTLEFEVLWCVCLFVCLSVTWKPYGQASPNFCAHCLWLWLGSLLMVLRCVMSFEFCGWCIFSYHGTSGQNQAQHYVGHQVAVPVEHQTTAVFGWDYISTSQWSSGKTLVCSVLGPRIEAHCGLVYHDNHWARVVHPYCSASVDSAFHLPRDSKMSTDKECQGKVGRITSAGCQVTLCDPI